MYTKRACGWLGSVGGWRNVNFGSYPAKLGTQYVKVIPDEKQKPDPLWAKTVSIHEIVHPS